MSETRRTTRQPRDPRYFYFLAEGFVSVARGGSAPVVMSYIDNLSNDGTHYPTTDAQVIYTITVMPVHGTLTKSGALMGLGSQFTQQDCDNGIIIYQHDGSTYYTDPFQAWAVVSETPGVVSPYVMWAYQNWDTATGPSTEAGFEVGMVLAGTGPGAMPTEDWFSSAFNNNPGQPNNMYEIVLNPTTNHPNEGMFIWTFTAAGQTNTGTFPPANAGATVTCPGLSFTLLYSQVQNTKIWGDSQPWFDYYTFNAQLWYAQVPTVLSVAPTLTVTWEDQYIRGGGVNAFQVQMTFAVGMTFYNIDPAHPWGSNPGAFQTATIPTLPVQTAPVSSVNDQISLPLMFMLITGKEYFTTGYPRIVSAGLGDYGGGGWGGYFGGGECEVWYRADTYYAPITVNVSHTPTETLTDAELFFTATSSFVDFSNAANRRLFVSASNGAQYLGPHGGLPFNTTPAVYLSALPTSAAAFASNNGVGGAFAISGSIDLADSAPGCTLYGVTEATGPEGDPDWRLSVSDDGGRTWSPLVKPRSMGQLGEYQQRLRWLKMGQFRQRLVRLEATSAVRRNIIGVYADNTPGMG